MRAGRRARLRDWRFGVFENFERARVKSLPARSLLVNSRHAVNQANPLPQAQHPAWSSFRASFSYLFCRWRSEAPPNLTFCTSESGKSDLAATPDKLTRVQLDREWTGRIVSSVGNDREIDRILLYQTKPLLGGRRRRIKSIDTCVLVRVAGERVFPRRETCKEEVSHTCTHTYSSALPYVCVCVCVCIQNDWK